MAYHQCKQRTNRSIGRMCTSVMEHSLSQPQDDMSSEQISQNTNGDGHPHLRPQTFRRGLFTKGGGPAIPPHRLVLPCLVLVNVVLLIAAVVLGIYCAKAKEIQIPDSVSSPLFAELIYLRNQSDIIKEKLEIQATIVRERASHLELKTQVKQKKTVTDGLQKKIEALLMEKTKLQSNKTSLEQSCGRCPQGWLLLKSSCYYFSKNEDSSKKNWQDSRAQCVSQGGDLVVISNLEEQQLISNNLPKYLSSSSWWLNGYWIGLTSVVTTGTWVWVNNVTGTETMYWRNGQPSTVGPQSGNCAAFYSHIHDARSTWYNGKCLELHLNWICEMEPR